MMSYRKDIKMTDRDIVKNYLEDLRLDPKYYHAKRSYFMEMSWMHWAEDEIIERLDNFPDLDCMQIIRGFKSEMLSYMQIAKTDKGKGIFQTAFYLGYEIEDFLNALKGELEV